MPLVDYSTFTDCDVAKIALQRTRHLLWLPVIGSWSYRRWVKGDMRPLMGEARLRRSAILSGATSDNKQEFDRLECYLADRQIERMVDIGCGHAIIDLFFWRRYKPHIHLVDIEESASHRHHYHDNGSGYACLDAARQFLEANGVPAASIKTTNPRVAEIAENNVDLILSSLSAGFHYPISTYTAFALKALKPGGLLIFDARAGTGQREMLSGFSRIEVIETGLKHQRLAAIR